MMFRLLNFAWCLIFVAACSATGLAQQAGMVSKNQSDRVIVIGDIHGDYSQFQKLLRLTGLVDKKNRWVGQQTHLVQMGDIPDRGPDSRKAMDLLMKLEQQAAKAGGKVTVLIGNHEAMMMTDDLRYVHPGEYKAFRDKNSKARRRAYYAQTLDHLRNTVAEDDLPKFDKDYKAQWQNRFPLGYVEHRQAWSPSGKYGKWILTHSAVVKVANSIFAHGGISSRYSSMKISDMNTRVRTALVAGIAQSENSIIEEQSGPLWDRSWANLAENEANEAELDRILAAFGVQRMVVAHTPILPVVLPRFGGKVLLVDVGLSEHYGHGFSALEIVDGVASAIIDEHKIALPTDSEQVESYLNEVAALLPNGARVVKYQLARIAAQQEILPQENEAK